MQDKAWSDFISLPVEAQRQAADFIAFLRERHQRSAARRRPADLASEPFVGMWGGREEMQDSAAWVRNARRREWGEPTA